MVLMSVDDASVCVCMVLLSINDACVCVCMVLLNVDDACVCVCACTHGFNEYRQCRCVCAQISTQMCVNTDEEQRAGSLVSHSSSGIIHLAFRH